jgi:hypothetical protein
MSFVEARGQNECLVLDNAANKRAQIICKLKDHEVSEILGFFKTWSKVNHSMSICKLFETNVSSFRRLNEY